MSSIPATTFVVFGRFLVEKWAKLPNLAEQKNVLI